MTNDKFIMYLSIDISDPYSIDANIDSLLSVPSVRNRIYERIKYNISSPGKVFFEALDDFMQNHKEPNKEPYDIAHLFRTIHQLEQEVAYLSHQLVNYDSFINKYDKLAVKVDSLKRQNKRLITRNNELVHAMHRPKNNR